MQKKYMEYNVMGGIYGGMEKFYLSVKNNSLCIYFYVKSRDTIKQAFLCCMEYQTPGVHIPSKKWVYVDYYLFKWSFHKVTFDCIDTKDTKLRIYEQLMPQKVEKGYVQCLSQ